MYCYELMKIPSFKNIKLVAGELGLDRKISWVYVLQTPSLKGWVYGGEILFIVNANDIYKIIQDAVLHQLSCAVVLKNEQNESVLNEETINLANKERFPLFEMDYNIKTLDVTREISTYIIHQQEKINYLNYFFYNILISENPKKKDIEDFALHYGFHSEHVFFIALIKSEDSSKLNNINTLLQMYIEDKDVRFLTIILNSRVVILAYTLLSKLNKAKKLLKSSYTMLNEKFSDPLYMGIGNRCNSLLEVRESYMRSIKALALCTNEKRIIDYEELGFPRLLLNTIDEEELKNYAKHILGKVKEFDEKNQTLYLKTMEEYVLSNGNINKTSSQLYIHRNTCIYRITKIKELFQIDLEDPYVRADILNSLTICRFLERLNG